MERKKYRGTRIIPQDDQKQTKNAQKEKKTLTCGHQMKKGFNHETTTCKSTFGRQLNNNPWESRAGFTEPKTQVKLKPPKIEINC